MVQTIRKLLNGELQHPAMDKENIKIREARIAKLVHSLEVERQRLWATREVGGNVCIKAYLRAIGLELSKNETVSLAKNIRTRALAFGQVIGKVRMRRYRRDEQKDYMNRWETVSTFAPEVIYAALIEGEWVPENTAPADPEALAFYFKHLTDKAQIWHNKTQCKANHRPLTMAVFQRSTGPTVTASSPEPRQPELAL